MGQPVPIKCISFELEKKADITSVEFGFMTPEYYLKKWYGFPRRFGGIKYKNSKYRNERLKNENT